MLSSIEEALLDLAEGKVVIVVDDEDRENEGDFIIPADKITPETINFMTKFGRGLICTPLTSKRAEELELDLMVPSNDSDSQAAFTVSIDSIHGGSGISAKDRNRTIEALTNDKTRSQDFCRPGHIFPLIARNGGVLERRGHTEAAVDLAILSGHSPVAVLCEILDDDGETATADHLAKLAKIFRLKIISIEDLVTYVKKSLKNDTEKLLINSFLN